MTKYNVVLLTSGTVGTTSQTEVKVGDTVIVILRNENGMPINETGIVEGILDQYDY